MIKKILRIAILSSLAGAAGAATVYEDDVNELNVYGRLESQIANGDESFADDDTRARMTGRLGFTMSRALTRIDNTKVIGKLEWQVRTEANDTKLDEGEDLEARYIYVGIDNDTIGEVIVGRTKNPLYQVMKVTDKYNNYTPGIYNYGISSIDGSYKYNRQDATLQWNGKFDGHEIQVAYVFGNGESAPLDNAIMASYRKVIKVAGFQITPSIGISQFNREDGTVAMTDTSRKQHNQALAGLEFRYANFTFGVTGDYVNIDQDNGKDDYFGLDTIVAYKWNEFKILSGYSFLDEKDKDIYEKEDWRIEGQWTLAKKTYLSLTYDRELKSKNKDSEDDAITLGLRFNF